MSVATTVAEEDACILEGDREAVDEEASVQGGVAALGVTALCEEARHQGVILCRRAAVLWMKNPVLAAAMVDFEGLAEALMESEVAMPTLGKSKCVLPEHMHRAYTLFAETVDPSQRQSGYMGADYEGNGDLVRNVIWYRVTRYIV